jgi:hypothetical protein
MIDCTCPDHDGEGEGHTLGRSAGHALLESTSTPASLGGVISVGGELEHASGPRNERAIPSAAGGATKSQRKEVTVIKEHAERGVSRR